MEAINLRLAHQQCRIFHEFAESFTGRGGLLLRSAGSIRHGPCHCR